MTKDTSFMILNKRQIEYRKSFSLIDIIHKINATDTSLQLHGANMSTYKQENYHRPTKDQNLP